MGEGTPRVIPTESPERLEGEIATIRGNIVGLVREIERRRREFADWRSHRMALALLAGGVLVVAGIGIAAARRRARLAPPRQRLREAVGLYAMGPRATGLQGPGLGRKLLGAAMTALVSTAVRALTRRTVERA